MTTELRSSRFSPSLWVPTLYFAEGLPFYAVNMMALIFYSRMGVSNMTITATVSLLGLPWSLKPLWSPFLEMYKTKKFFVVLMEFGGGLSLGCWRCACRCRAISATRWPCWRWSPSALRPTTSPPTASTSPA